MSYGYFTIKMKLKMVVLWLFHIQVKDKIIFLKLVLLYTLNLRLLILWWFHHENNRVVFLIFQSNITIKIRFKILNLFYPFSLNYVQLHQILNFLFKSNHTFCFNFYPIFVSNFQPIFVSNFHPTFVSNFHSIFVSNFYSNIFKFCSNFVWFLKFSIIWLQSTKFHKNLNKFWTFQLFKSDVWQHKWRLTKKLLIGSLHFMCDQK